MPGQEQMSGEEHFKKESVYGLPVSLLTGQGSFLINNSLFDQKTALKISACLSIPYGLSFPESPEMAGVESEMKNSTPSSPVTQKEAGRGGPFRAHSVFPDSLQGCVSSLLRLQVTGVSCADACCFRFSFVITTVA